MSGIVCIIKTEKGKFKPLLANLIESEGDNDSFLNVIATMPPQETLEAAQKELEGKVPKGYDYYEKPVRFSDGAMQWLSEVKAAQE